MKSKEKVRLSGRERGDSREVGTGQSVGKYCEGPFGTDCEGERGSRQGIWTASGKDGKRWFPRTSRWKQTFALVLGVLASER